VTAVGGERTGRAHGATTGSQYTEAAMTR
jgi:hypothetical protein